MAEPHRPLKENLYENKTGFLHIASFSEQFPWPKNLPKGKPFLINDTYVRVDGVDYVMVQALQGKFEPIDIMTPVGGDFIQTPKCEGYVFAPLPRWMFHTQGNSSPFRRRCMTQGELNEAEQDHTLVRDMRMEFSGYYKFLQADHYNMTRQDGSNDAHLRLTAFNRALHKKRVQLAREMGDNYDWQKLIKSTYGKGWFTLYPDRKPNPYVHPV
jgi:hypothetical protein